MPLQNWRPHHLLPGLLSGTTSGTAWAARQPDGQRGITPDECLATGHDQPWAVWKTLNRLRVGKGRCKASMKKWTLTSSDACVCGEPQTMEHIMSCTYAPQCTGDDLAEPNAAALACANHWKDVI